QHRDLDRSQPVRGLRQRPAQHLVEPVHQHVHQDRRDGAGAAPGMADLRDDGRDGPARGCGLLPGRTTRKARPGPDRGRPGDRGSRHRLVTDDPILRGPLYDDLVGALQKVPEIAGRRLILTALSGGITNRNFRVDAAGTDERWVIRLAGNDTHLLGISREVEHAATVAAAGVGVGPEVTAFIRPEGYLVTRFIV